MTPETKLRHAKRIYKEFLEHGITFTTCMGCAYRDNPYKGNIRTEVRCLDLHWIPQATTLLHFTFVSWVRQLDGKWVAETQSDFSLETFDSGQDQLTLLTDWTAKELRERELASYKNPSCTVSVGLQAELENLTPSHPTILPSFVAAYVEFKGRFFEEVRKAENSVQPRYKPYVAAIFDASLKRLSSAIARAQRDQIKRDFGIE